MQTSGLQVMGARIIINYSKLKTQSTHILEHKLIHFRLICKVTVIVAIDSGYDKIMSISDVNVANVSYSRYTYSNLIK